MRRFDVPQTTNVGLVWLDAATAATLLGMGIPTLRKTAAGNRIRVRRIPGRRGERYFRADVEALLARLEAEETRAIADAAARAEAEARGPRPKPNVINAHMKKRAGAASP
jgi:hypothetical protein